MITEMFFDVETKKLFSDIEDRDPAKLELSLISVLTREVNELWQVINEKMISFWEKDLDNLWPMFEKANRVIGFNSIKFDVPVLSPYSPINLNKLPHLDIMAEVRKTLGRSLSLNAIAKDTLGMEKSDIGINAVTYFANGDEESLTKLKKYCEDDVRLTKDIYDFGFKNKLLKYTDNWNNQKTLPVDFSYPESIKEDNKQIGLF